MASRTRYQPQQTSGAATLPRAVGSRDGLSRLANSLSKISSGIRAENQQDERDSVKNALAQYQLDVGAIDRDSFTNTEAFNAEVAKTREATLGGLTITNEQLGEQLRLEADAFDQNAGKSFSQRQEGIDYRLQSTKLTNAIAALDMGAVDPKLGGRIYDYSDPNAAKNLQKDLTQRVKAMTQTSGLPDHLQTQMIADAQKSVQNKVRSFNQAQGAYQKDARTAQSALAIENATDSLAGGTLDFEAYGGAVDNALRLQYPDQSEAFIEQRKAEQMEVGTTAWVNRKLADGDHAVVRELLNDEGFVSTLSDQAYGAIQNALESQGAKDAAEMVANTIAAVTNRDDDAPSAEEVQARVLEMTGDVAAAQEAVAQVVAAQVQVADMGRPLAEVRGEVIAVKAALEVNDPDYASVIIANDKRLAVAQKAETARQADPVAFAIKYADLDPMDTASLMRWQEYMGVKEPRVMTNAAADAVLELLNDTEVEPTTKVESLASLMVTHEGHSATLDETLVDAGMPKRVSLLMKAMENGGVRVNQAGRVFGALMSDAPKINADTKAIVASSTADAISEYRAYGNALASTVGDYAYLNETLTPTIEAMEHILSQGQEGAPDAEALAKMFLGDREVVIEDDVQMLLPKGHGVNPVVMEALRQWRVQFARGAAKGNKNAVISASMPLLGHEGILASEDGENFDLVNPANGKTLVSITLGELQPYILKAESASVKGAVEEQLARESLRLDDAITQRLSERANNG